MIKKSVIKVFGIISFIALLQVVGTILLARNLTKPQIGAYRLILTIVEYGSLLALLGADHSAVRFFSSGAESFQSYDWRSLARRLLPFICAIAALFGLLMSALYKLSLAVFFAVLALTIAVSMITFLASLLRAKRKFALSIFLARQNYILLLPAIILLIALGRLSVKTAIIGFFVSAAISLSALVYYCLKKLPSGNTPLPSSFFTNAGYYFALSLGTITLLQSGQFFIAKMLSLKDLAVYTIVASIMRLFEFTQDATYYVLAPKFNEGKTVPAKKTISYILLVSFAISAFYLVFGGHLLRWFFSSRYDEGARLIPLFIAVGIARSLYVLPSSIIGARSSQNILRRQSLIFICVAVLNMALLGTFIRFWQLQGVLTANLVSWTLLCLLAGYDTRGYWRQRHE